MIRAQAETIQFPLADSLGGAITGATLTATLSKDGGAFTATTNAVTEVGSGDYAVLLTATEKDFASGVLIATDGTYATRVQMTTTGDLSESTTAILDILQADVDVDTTAKTITWKHKDTAAVLLTKTYDDSGPAQGLT